jgi:hypothetical protein
MVGEGYDASFFAKSLSHIRVVVGIEGKGFDCKRFFCLWIESKIKPAHASFVQKSLNFIRANESRKRGFFVGI